MSIAAIVIVVRGKGSILVKISHRDVASPSGKLPARFSKRNSCCLSRHGSPRDRPSPA
jgi:hypothetical protein